MHPIEDKKAKAEGYSPIQPVFGFLPSSLRARLGRLHRGLRVARLLLKALVSTSHPVLVTLIATRRCNLSCAYCNEYDHTSQPVPLETLKQRVDKLASMGTSIITISGGEPMLHPQLEELVGYIRRRGMVATVITNGYLLTEKRIKALDQAGLDYLQISIDNIMPDDVSMKSLKVLDKKLALLARHARFSVNVNSVIGAGIQRPQEALTVSSRARELGLATSIGIIHDGQGRMRPLNETEIGIYRRVKRIGGKGFSVVDRFQENLVRGRPNNWKCRAGARYLYVDEDGLVHWCSQQRGYPAIPLLDYTSQDMKREYYTQKPCAPYCTVQCVHRASLMDAWRGPQRSSTRRR